MTDSAEIYVLAVSLCCIPSPTFLQVSLCHNLLHPIRGRDPDWNDIPFCLLSHFGIFILPRPYDCTRQSYAPIVLRRSLTHRNVSSLLPKITAGSVSPTFSACFQKTVTNDVASSLGNDIKCIPLLVGFMLRQEVSLLGAGCDELLPAEIRRTKFFNLKLPPDPSESSNGLDLYQQTLKIAAEDTANFSTSD